MTASAPPATAEKPDDGQAEKDKVDRHHVCEEILFTMLSAKCMTGTNKATDHAQRPASRRPAATPTRKTTTKGAMSSRLIAQVCSMSLGTGEVSAGIFAGLTGLVCHIAHLRGQQRLEGGTSSV